MPRKTKLALELGETSASLIEKLDKIKKEYQQLAGRAISEGLAELFERFPKFQSVGWRQYAPSFNDGDPCVFSAHVDSYSLFVNGVNPDYGSDEYEEDFELTEAEHERIAKAASKLLSAVDEQVLRSMFGDGVEVTIHRDGKVETEDYYDY